MLFLTVLDIRVLLGQYLCISLGYTELGIPFGELTLREMGMRDWFPKDVSEGRRKLVSCQP